LCFFYALKPVYSILSFISEYLFYCLSYAGKLRAPKWYKRPVGVSFGFGGKLVSFRPRSSAGGASEVAFLGEVVLLMYCQLVLCTYSFQCFSQVFLHNLVTEDSLVSRSSEFESAIQNGEKPLLKALCDKKSQESEYASVY